MPIEVMSAGWAVSLFQASQAASMIVRRFSGSEAPAVSQTSKFRTIARANHLPTLALGSGYVTIGVGAVESILVA
jgi:hypothetical protein